MKNIPTYDWRLPPAHGVALDGAEQGIHCGTEKFCYLTLYYALCILVCKISTERTVD